MDRKQLKQLNDEIAEAKATLSRLNKEIEGAELAGADALRGLSIEVDQLEKEKARLMKQLLSLKQKIDEQHQLVTTPY